MEPHQVLDIIEDYLWRPYYRAPFNMITRRLLRRHRNKHDAYSGRQEYELPSM